MGRPAHHQLQLPNLACLKPRGVQVLQSSTLFLCCYTSFGVQRGVAPCGRGVVTESCHADPLVSSSSISMGCHMVWVSLAPYVNRLCRLCVRQLLWHCIDSSGCGVPVVAGCHIWGHRWADKGRAFQAGSCRIAHGEGGSVG
jgi:hypothetical protein